MLYLCVLHFVWNYLISFYLKRFWNVLCSQSKHTPSTHTLYQSMSSTTNRASQWASCQIRKIVGCACAGNARNVFLATASSRSRLASRHACRDRILVVLFEGGGRENVHGIPGLCATHHSTHLTRGQLIQLPSYISNIMNTCWDLWYYGISLPNSPLTQNLVKPILSTKSISVAEKLSSDFCAEYGTKGFGNWEISYRHTKFRDNWVWSDFRKDILYWVVQFMVHEIVPLLGPGVSEVV